MFLKIYEDEDKEMSSYFEMSDIKRVFYVDLSIHPDGEEDNKSWKYKMRIHLKDMPLEYEKCKLDYFEYHFETSEQLQFVLDQLEEYSKIELERAQISTISNYTTYGIDKKR